jgi:hypothetical protein
MPEFKYLKTISHIGLATFMRQLYTLKYPKVNFRSHQTANGQTGSGRVERNIDEDGGREKFAVLLGANVSIQRHLDIEMSDGSHLGLSGMTATMKSTICRHNTV